MITWLDNSENQMIGYLHISIIQNKIIGLRFIVRFSRFFFLEKQSGEIVYLVHSLRYLIIKRGQGKEHKGGLIDFVKKKLQKIKTICN